MRITSDITDDVIERAARAAISDTHDDWAIFHGEPKVGGHNHNFIEELENRFIEYLTDDVDIEPEEAVEIMNNCDIMQDEIALYTYTGRA